MPVVSRPSHSEALAREVKRALSAARLSAPAAATKLGWDRKRLYRWMDGSVSPRLSAVDELSRAIGQPLTIRLGITKEPPEPTWLEGLADGIAGKVIAELTASREDDLRLLIDDLEQRLAQRFEAPRVRTDTADQDG